MAPLSRGGAHRRPRLLAVALFAGGLGGCTMTDPRFDGPMPVRNQHPAQLTVLHLDPVSVGAPREGEVDARFDTAYTSLFLAGSGNGNTLQLDGEVLRTALRARVGLGSGVAVGMELPFLYAAGGFLDGFVIDWHDTFGLPNQGRDIAPRDDFVIEAQQQGQVVYRLNDDEFGIGDVPLTASWTFLAPTGGRPFGLALRGGVELPTGDEDDGFGNGAIDWSIGLAAGLRTGPLSFTGHVQYTFAGTPDYAQSAGFEYSDVTSAGIELEWPLDETWTALVQTEFETSTLRDLDFAFAADDQWLLWGGLRARLGSDTSLELALGEDLAPDVSPDFSIWLGLAHEFGR